MWTSEEKNFLRSLSSPHKIQSYLDRLIYNPMDDAASVRYVLLSGDAHCLEGGLLAAAALELQGHPPLMVNLVGHNDDNHVITIYRMSTGWGSIAKSNTVLLRGRAPVYKTVRELVMSYFDFYFNVKGAFSLRAYSSPINLNRFNHWEWRTTDHNLVELGRSFNDCPHLETVPLSVLKKLPPVERSLRDACFLGADPSGLYQAD